MQQVVRLRLVARAFAGFNTVPGWQPSYVVLRSTLLGLVSVQVPCIEQTSASISSNTHAMTVSVSAITL